MALLGFPGRLRIQPPAGWENDKKMTKKMTFQTWQQNENTND